MKTILTLALAAVAFTAVPANAVTVYDAYTSFDGVQGTGQFYYGAANDDFSIVSTFGANTNCFIAGSICLQAAANFDVPGATKSTLTSYQYNSVNVPDDRLLLHPGPNANDGNVYAAFVAPITSSYNLSALFSVQDISPTGVNVSLLYGSQAQLTSFGSASLGSGNPTYSYAGTRYLAQGDVVIAVINRAGNYGSDSTGLNFTLAAVPEPASWALLIAGFGLTGAVLRRRRAVALTA